VLNGLARTAVTASEGESPVLREISKQLRGLAAVSERGGFRIGPTTDCNDTWENIDERTCRVLAPESLEAWGYQELSVAVVMGSGREIKVGSPCPLHIYIKNEVVVEAPLTIRMR